MPDRKISELPALTGVQIATGDLLPIVDISDTTMAATGTNKTVTADALAESSSLTTKFVQRSNNFSDIPNTTTARTNLGLGGAATLSVGTTAGTVAAGNDSRMTDARTPTAHQASHRLGGADAITPSTQAMANADATVSAGVSVVTTSVTLTAIRTLTLPAASTVPAGLSILVADTFGAINGANTITIARAGTDTINGATSVSLSLARSHVQLISNGSSSWSFNANDLQRSNNLSDLTSASTARTNLGLGSAATTAASAYLPINAPGVPIYRSGGGYYMFPLTATGSGAFQSNGDCPYSPFMLPVDNTPDRIGIEVVTAGSAGSVHRLGIWANNNGVPGTLLLDAGTVATDTTGIKEIVISQALAANTLYWAGVAQQGAPATRAVLRISFNNQLVLNGANPTYTVTGYCSQGITGAFASNPSLGSGTYGGGHPRVALRLT